MKLYERLAQLVQQNSNCIKSCNEEWERRSRDEADSLVKNYLPSGSGIDCGTKLDWIATLKNPDRLVLTVEFHHMNEDGFYDGWTSHQLTVIPSLAFGFRLAISGRNRNGIKECLHDAYSFALEDEEWHLRETYKKLLESKPELAITRQGELWACSGHTFTTYDNAVNFAVNKV